jgi:hypothetical protein
MPQAVINGVGKAGIRNPAALDSDAAAFITAATLTDETQKTAVNDLVLDLKAAGLWTKMKAVYPIVGGTAASHKWNLKDPRDLDAAFRLNFIGGWTHSSTGATPNGSNGFANTLLTPSTAGIGQNNIHLSFYSRTNIASGGVSFGAKVYSVPSVELVMRLRDSSGYYAIMLNSSANIYTLNPASSSQGHFTMNRIVSNEVKMYRNGTVSVTAANNSSGNLSRAIYLSARNDGTNPTDSFDNRQCAFASIGDGLTDLESNLFYQIVEKFQAALSRNVNTSKSFYFNKNYSNEVNTFLFNGGITDATQMSATNTLVNTLKTAGIWSKMKAVYPMVGGTATAHKLNLVTPVDSTSAYALTFNGGWTHTSTGALPNGTTGWANTNFVASGVLTLHNCHLSYYSRTNNLTTNAFDCFMGAAGNYPNWYGVENLYMGTNNLSKVSAAQHTTNQTTAVAVGNITNRKGLFLNTKLSVTPTTLKIIKNGVSLGNATTPDVNYGVIGVQLPIYPIYLAALNNKTNSPFQQYFSNAECSFSSIGDGLTDAEALTFYNAVQAFQTTLGRQV